MLNLCLNGLDAMETPESLTIHTGGGTTAVLTVRDTGQGMPAEVRERAFGRFYTTKGRAGARAWGCPWSTAS